MLPEFPERRANAEFCLPTPECATFTNFCFPSLRSVTLSSDCCAPSFRNAELSSWSSRVCNCRRPITRNLARWQVRSDTPNCSQKLYPGYSSELHNIELRRTARAQPATETLDAFPSPEGYDHMSARACQVALSWPWVPYSHGGLREVRSTARARPASKA